MTSATVEAEQMNQYVESCLNKVRELSDEAIKMNAAAIYSGESQVLSVECLLDFNLLLPN